MLVPDTLNRPQQIPKFQTAPTANKTAWIHTTETERETDVPSRLWGCFFSRGTKHRAPTVIPLESIRPSRKGKMRGGGKMKFGIIGAGIVGTALAVRLEEAGHQCIGVHTREPFFI